MELAYVVLAGTVSICGLFLMWTYLAAAGMMVPPPDEDWYWKGEVEQE